MAGVLSETILLLENTSSVKKKKTSGSALKDIPSVTCSCFADMVAIMGNNPQAAVLSEGAAVQSPPPPPEDLGAEASGAGASTSASSVLWEEPRALDFFTDVAPSPPEPVQQRLQKRRRTSASDGGEQESLARAAVEHLGALRAPRTRQNKDDIYYFCMRLDARLRTLPRDVAEDLINNIENTVHDTCKQCRAAVRDSDQ